MTVQEAKDELRNYLAEAKYLEEKQADIDGLRRLAEKVTYCISEVPRGSGGWQPNIFEERMVKMLDMQDAYGKLFDAAAETRLRVENRIAELPQPFKNILYYRYIKNWGLQKIAMQMNYEYKWLSNLHNQAIRKYAENKSA